MRGCQMIQHTRGSRNVELCLTDRSSSGSMRKTRTDPSRWDEAESAGCRWSLWSVDWFFISSVQCQVQSCWSVTFLLVHVRFTRTELLQAGNHISFRRSWTDPWCSCSASFVGRFPSCETLSLQSFMSPVRNQQTRRKHLENVNNFRWNRPSAILTLEQEDTLKGPANKHIAEFNINQGDWFVRTEVDGPRPQARRTAWPSTDKLINCSGVMKYLTSPCFQTRLKLSSATIKNSNKTSPNCEITYNNTVCWSL